MLSPQELHRLANKTRDSVTGNGDKAGCHSDVADADAARRLQDEKLDPETLEPFPTA